MKAETKLSSEMKRTGMGKEEGREERSKGKGELGKERIERRRRRGRMMVCSKYIAYFCGNVFVESRIMYSKYIPVKRQSTSCQVYFLCSFLNAICI